MTLAIVLLIVSLVALYFGAEFALDSAERIGKFLGLSPLVIGLVIVGFGTSLPEFFVSQMATYRGSIELALGNILGSNVANIFLVLGVSALFSPLVLGGRELKFQFIFHLILTCVLGGVLYFKEIALASSFIFFIFFVIYFSDTFRKMEKEARKNNQSIEALSLDELETLWKKAKKEVG